VLTAKFNSGLFEHSTTDLRRTAQIMGNRSHAQLARKVADEAIVLLKNDRNLLPLKLADIKTLAVIGPNADKARLGGYSGEPPYFVTVLQGIRRRVGNAVTVNYAEGVRISEPDQNAYANKFSPYEAPPADRDTALIAQAVDAARSADVVVLVIGENETITREAFGAGLSDKPSFGDTDTLELPGRQNELVREIAKLGKPTVAVLLNGRPLSIEQLSASVPAILEGWYLGQETGNAIAGVLFGDTNPSGRLPVTVARSVGQLPVFYYRKPSARLGYVFNSNAPLYPFGYGLSYTSFTYGTPTLDKTEITRDGTARISVSVSNSGTRAGEEVVQLYVHPKVSSAVQPIMRLAGFERCDLKPGETKTVSFDVGPEQLAIWDSQMKHVVEPGKVDVMVGSNAQQTTSVELEVTP
jgi:beta-glucosidase